LLDKKWYRTCIYRIKDKYIRIAIPLLRDGFCFADALSVVEGARYKALSAVEAQILPIKKPLYRGISISI
jgi:hypothetical protein